MAVAEGEAKGKAEGIALGEKAATFRTAWKAYEQKMVTAEQAAGLADMTVEDFLEKGKALQNNSLS